MGFYVTVEPGVNIYVEDLNPGGRKTIFFIHGWPASHRMFEYQLNELPKMGYRCIAIDTRGFGSSDKPWRGYDYDRLSDDVRAVMETMKLKNITLGGHSTGGAIAIRYMARHQGWGVSKLALFAAAAPSLIQRPYFQYGLSEADVKKIIAGANQNRPKMLRDFGEMFFYRFITRAFSDWFFQMGLEAAGWSTVAVAETWLNEERLFSDLGKIRVPTLILHGIHDQVCRFPLATAQNEEIAASRLIPFQYSGHGLFYDERERFNRELAKFVEEECG